MTGSRPARSPATERGSATVLMVGIIAVALVLAGVLGAVARATSAQAQAQGVADLAALASAREHAVTGAAPCPVAQRVALRHGAHLAGCRADGPIVRVEVTVAAAPLPGWHTDARALARAGPVGLADQG